MFDVRHGWVIISQGDLWVLWLLNYPVGAEDVAMVKLYSVKSAYIDY